MTASVAPLFHIWKCLLWRSIYGTIILLALPPPPHLCMVRRSTVAWWHLVRSGRVPPPVETVVQRSRSFGTAVANAGWAALVARHDGYAPMTLLAAPAAPKEPVAQALGAAVGARAEEAAPPPLGEARRLGWLVASPDVLGAHESQAGGDPAEVALVLARVLVPGSWVALSLRAPSRSERNRARRWFKSQGVALSHYSTEAEALVASAYAGAPDAGTLRALLAQLASALPGFEVNTSVVTTSTAAWAAPAGLGVGLWGAGLYAGQLRPADVASGVLGLVSVGLAADVLPTSAHQLRRRLSSGLLPEPPRRALPWPPRAPRAETTIRGGPGKPDRVKPAHQGDWPLARRSFVVGPAMVVGVASPHGAGAEPGATRSRPVPAALVGDIGPLVGNSSDAQAVHISSAPEDVGVAVLGIPGTGKTAIVQALWGWSCLERTRPSGKPGRPGAEQVLIAFETKGSGPGEWVAWANAVGVKPLVVSLADPATPAVDLFAGPGTVAERAGRFVDAMIYAFGDQAIQGRSTEALMAALCGALVAGPGTLAVVGIAGGDRLRAAHVLLGGEGDQVAVKLAAALAMESEGSEEDVADALRRLAPMFDQGVSATVRRGLTEAARNKLGLLREAGHWWSSDRRQVSWDQVIDHRGVVVLVTSGAKGALATNMTAMLAYALRGAIVRRCESWQENGRSVGIFADELATLAGTSPEVVAWVRSEGRSFGVRPVFATQYPEQLVPAVRTALLSFGSTIWFRQNVPSVVAEATSYLQIAGGDDWAPEDIDGLPPYHAVLRASVGGRGMTPVVMAVPYFAADKAGFAAVQGY